MHPQDRASHAVELAVQAVTVTQVDAADPDMLPPRVARVVLLVRGVPEGTVLRRHVLAQALLEDGVDKLDRDHPVLADRLGERVDGRRAQLDAVPAPQLAAARALEVHRGAERDDALHRARWRGWPCGPLSIRPGTCPRRTPPRCRARRGPAGWRGPSPSR